MHLIGRHHNVRPLGPHGWGPPYMLDSKWSTVAPYPCDEWWKSPAGVWQQIGHLLHDQRGSFNVATSRQMLARILLGPPMVDPTAGETSINSAYTAGSAGAAIGARLAFPDAITVSKIYFYVNTLTGTAANVNDMESNIYGDSSGAPNTGGGAITGSTGTVDPAATTGWKAVTGLTASLTAGTPYYISISDADGNGTDFARLLRFFTLLPDRTYGSFMSILTSNGWSTTSRSSDSAVMVIVGNAGESIGQPFAGYTASTSNTRERGLFVSDGFSIPMLLYGVSHVSSTAITGIRIWQNSDGPTGSPWKSATLAMGSATGGTSRLGAIFSPMVQLSAQVPYRFTCTYGSSTTAPSRWQIVTTGVSDLRAAMPGGGAWYWTTTDGVSSWVDTLDEWPAMNLWFENLPTASGGSGGLIGSRGGLIQG